MRIQGTTEDPNKTKEENLAPTNNEINNLLHLIGAKAHVTKIQKLGNFRNERKSQEWY